MKNKREDLNARLLLTVIILAGEKCRCRFIFISPEATMCLVKGTRRDNELGQEQQQIITYIFNYQPQPTESWGTSKPQHENCRRRKVMIILSINASLFLHYWFCGL